MQRRWHFSILLGLVYLAIFHFWLVASAPERAASKFVVVLLLIFGLFRAVCAGYFVNRWDAIFHATVVLDVVVEGLVIPLHEGYGFYGCALAFAVVVGGYRCLILSSRPT